MAQIVSDLDARLSTRLRDERTQRGWSVAALAERSGVSRAMIARVETGRAQPTAALLGRLSAAFGLPLSRLFARMEEAPSRVARSANQVEWTDPASGYVRRALSPSGDADLQLTTVQLPPGAKVRFPAEAYTFIRQQVWVLRGSLTLREGGETHRLRSGDCVQFGPPSAVSFENRSRTWCRYLVAVARR